MSFQWREWPCIRFDRHTIAVMLATRHTLHMPILGIRFKVVSVLSSISIHWTHSGSLFLHNGTVWTRYEQRAYVAKYAMSSYVSLPCSGLQTHTHKRTHRLANIFSHLASIERDEARPTSINNKYVWYKECVIYAFSSAARYFISHAMAASMCAFLLQSLYYLLPRLLHFTQIQMYGFPLEDLLPCRM